jgi:predicted ribosome quality control (RQC) complex YloA/Tae2 family protein
VHNNYYFLKRVSEALGQKLSGAVISECFSQSKEELVIRFETFTKPFIIKASLSPQVSCLSFPALFQRAKKNSVDLFPALIGLRVESVRQFWNERSFAIVFKTGETLLFKMHGNRSNLILFEESRVTLFKTSLEADAVISPDTLDRTIDWSYETFLQNHDEPAKLYFTFGKLVWNYLRKKNYSAKTAEQKWDLIQDVKRQLETNAPRITQIDGVPHLSMIDHGDIQKIIPDPLEAVTTYFHQFTQVHAFELEKAQTLSRVRARIQSGENYLTKVRAKLDDLKQDVNYKLWADLIMANLHTLTPGMENVQLNSFYDGHPIAVRLKNTISPQKNAELYYRKAKNQQIEIDHLTEAIRSKQKDIDVSRELLGQINASADMNSLRRITNSLSPAAKDAEEKNLPYHEFDFKGFRILVGRNAQANDELTLRHSYKEDLWLHAKDVSGSHVIVKHQAGKKFPKDVIERAAQLAAYNSKRKTDSLCPVSYTPKKFVRKRKGDRPGLVVVEREQVIMVVPTL